jgi:drug/metabolite transporter (DMT)-like permease
MIPLLAVSLLWAFSFGLVKGLSSLDPSAVAALRLAVSLAVFAPLLRPAGLRGATLRLALIGAVQFGAMYIFYIGSFAHLHAFEVALFTITTPVFVALADALAERRFAPRYLAAAALSMAGAGVVIWRSIGDSGVVGGFLLVQLSNLCFAAGQVAWRRAREAIPSSASDASLFAVPLAGALALTLAVSLLSADWRAFAPTPAQWASIAYLGAVATGLGFFLWNLGATRVNAGTLAAFNNVKIPLGIACSVLVFGEHADLPRLLAGGAVMAVGVWVAGPAGQLKSKPQVRRP